MEKMISKLTKIFAPKSIAVVGATEIPNKLGSVIMKNLLDAKFNGKVYPVNPKYTHVHGQKCYTRISEVPGRIDCVVIATPAEAVPTIVEECASKKASGIIILSGGFEEVNRKDLAEKIANIAKKSAMPIIGPNCLGIYNPYTKVDSVFLPRYKLERPKPGDIAFVTQSGAVGSVIMDLSAYYGIGISKFISYGNGTVLDESDYLEYLMGDKQTETIILYLEGAKDGRKLLNAMKKVNKVKPIIVLKAGRGAGGQAAAKSHTGNLAGSYLAYNAAFRQAKVTEADGINEVFNFVKIFNQPKARGRRIGVITNGGGIGVLVTDYIESENLQVAKFSSQTITELKKVVPSYGSVANPLDLVADADVAAYEKAIDTMMNDDGIDGIIVNVLTQTPPIDERILLVLGRANDLKKKPMAVIMVGGAYSENYLRNLEGRGVPGYNSPKAAVKAMERFVTYSRYRDELKK